MNADRRSTAIIINGTVAILTFLVLAVFMALTPADAGITTITNDAAPSIAAVPQDMLMEQANAGRTCDEEPVLTDHILFTDKAGVTTEITFDEALAASEAKTGTVRLYCSDAR